MRSLLKILFILLVAVSLKPAAYHMAAPSDVVVVRGNTMQLTAGRRPSWTDSVRLSVCRLPGLALQMQDIRFR